MIPKEIHPNQFAYFSMEVGLDSAMPTYSGGLGILAGDTLRAAADLGLPMIGVTLLHRKGYFRQTWTRTEIKLRDPQVGTTKKRWNRWFRALLCRSLGEL